MAMRTANVKRQTKETDIDLVLDIDGTGKSNINTGIGFFNHMLEGFSKHGFFDLTLKCDGDLDVDCHHTIEDCGIVLGFMTDLHRRNRVRPGDIIEHQRLAGNG